MTIADMPTPDSGGHRTNGTLEAAAKRAVSASRSAAKALQVKVNEAITALEAVAARAIQNVGDDKGAVEIVTGFHRAIEMCRLEAADLFARQLAALKKVNIALFGRTGTGKSSLIEALVHGDGETVSTGESDFTTKVRSVLWHTCRFIDTPGTNGWGRSARREVLEGRARKAVEISDLVVLCFDTQSQQQGEFEKIGAWVKEYGKPVIAVLNVRNPFWRRPASVPLASQRSRLSRTVREHVANIDSELARLSIFGVPVVSVSAQRALYARACDPYKGPHHAQFVKLRQEFGSTGLLRTSNFELLERVIVEALTQHALELRLGMLYGQVLAILQRLVRELEAACSEARLSAGVIDHAIEGILAVVGYPPSGSKVRSLLRQYSTGEDALTWVERVRGGEYEANTEGKLGRFARQRLEAKIGELRARSLSKAEDVIAMAFEAGRDLSSEEFSGIVFDQSRIRAAYEEVIHESKEFVRRETALVLNDAKLDFEFLLVGIQDVAGSSGTWKRRIGYASSGAGLVAGAASAWLVYAAGAAAVTPGGQAAAVALGLASLLTGIASMVAGWFGGRQRKRAEEARQRAWAESIASARRRVNDTYDGFVRQVTDAAAAITAEASLDLLGDPLARAGALWTLVSEAEVGTKSLHALQGTLPAAPDPQVALRDAANNVERTHGPNGGRGNVSLLLGEDWITDPTGLAAQEGESEPVRTRAYDPSFFRRMSEGFRTFVDRFGNSLQSGDGVRWLSETATALEADAEAVAVISELRAIADRHLPRLHVLGDYSSGKTSFVKRLLIDAGLPLPESLEVRSDPTTDRVHTYEWEHALLVDTPGLQSARHGHGGPALDTYPDASIIIYLLQPNLLVGSTTAVEGILKGDPGRGLVPKMERTIFVIHRTDELGVDPEAMPEEYVRLCMRKRAELQQALASRSIQIQDDRIFCMSADPYQLVGDRRDVNSRQFDQFRTWDGFEGFRKAMRDVGAKFARTGLDRSLLEGGLARLGRLGAAAAEHRSQLVTQLQSLSRLDNLLGDATAEGERLEEQLRVKARQLVDDHAFGSLERVAGAVDEAELQATANQLVEWWGLPQFQADAERWQIEAQTAIDAWFTRTSDLLSRTVTSPRFQAAVAAATPGFDPRDFAEASKGWFGRIMGLVAQPLKGATRNVVHWVGNTVGHTFRPWGVVKLTKILGRVGTGLAIAATAWDAINLYRSWQGEKRRNALRAELRAIVEETACQVLASLTDGNEDGAGPMAYLNAVRDYLRAAAEDLSREETGVQSRIEALQRRERSYRICMASAWSALGYKEGTA